MSNLTLTAVDSDALVLGGPAAEGGDVRIYRDGSNNLALFFDADAASNAKGLDIYPGVVIRNFCTIGQETLNTTYPLSVYGNVYCDSTIISKNGFASIANDSEFFINIPVYSPDVGPHKISLKIDGNIVLSVEAAGDGAGGVENLKAIVEEQLVYIPSSDTAITAAGGITVTKAIMRVVGDGGAVDITANPQIVAGTDGQVVIIQGTHDTNTVTLDDGNGLALSAQCVLAAQDNITLMYDSGDSEWIETSRTTVV